MSLKHTYNKPLIVILDPYKDGRLHGNISYYASCIYEEPRIKTLIRNFMYTIKSKLFGLKRPPKPYLSDSLNHSCKTIGIKITSSDYAKLTNGSFAYLNNTRHIVPDKLELRAEGV